ncbi:structural maintenance of chromosomes protein 6 [Episyrphus balteatus]|uniref:structural maintenance of chromosomes protein 6 n=1 Tax=Episyrphus balteatus TaxID=286459 RepID=UPI002486B5BA|nr:structural maintenance of chromosomes protein 6 [Episyrphus balteatus]
MAPIKKRPPPKSFTNEASTSKRRNISQNVIPSSSQPDDNQFRCGKVIRMHLTNFMCHSNLVVNFSDRVNFLVGNNGSGKSAILAALVLGLGAKASATNRSQSMKKFIKTDESFTNIQIEIANSGSDAFNHEIYGDKIIIVRHITQNASYYRIKNAQGNVVSKKADDLHKIMLYHNIQVENPVFVLNQENARIFLKDLDPAKNYELFIKATQIEMVAEKLNDCLRASKHQTLQLSCLGQTITQAKEEIDELKQSLAELDSIERVKKLLQKCELERLWIFVIEQEKQIQAVNMSIEELLTNKREFESMMINKDQFEQDCGNALSAIDTNLEEKRTLYSQENLKFNALKGKLVEMNDRCSEIDSSVENLKKKSDFIKSQIAKLKDYIAQKVSNNRVSVQDLRIKHERELSELNQQKQEVTAMLERTKHDAQNLIGNKGQIDQKIEDLRRNKHRLQEEARHIQSQIHNISANSKDALSIYGENVSRIVATINKLYQERQFSEMPRGPLGRYIEVVDARFRDAVENQLGGLINSFVVSNNKDYKILEGILKKYPNFNPTIITTKFMNKVYDVSRGKVRPPNGTYLLMDQIRCSDHVVLNCLIDRGSIETILLTESKEVAEKFSSQIENVPENLRKIILIKPGLEYCPEPSYRMYSLKIRPARFIQVDIRERIYQMEMEMKSNKEEIDRCELMLQDTSPQLQQIAQNIKKNRSLVEKHEYSLRGISQKINELESFEYPDSNEMDLLANELEECKSKLSQVEKQLEEKAKEISETKIEQRKITEDLTEQKVALKAIEDEMNQIKNKSDDIRVNLTSFMNSVRANESKVQEIDAGIQRFEEDKQTKIQALSELRTDAEKLGPRIDSERSESDINELIRKLKSKIKHRSQRNETPADLQQLIDSKSQTLAKNQELFSSVKETLEMLNESRIKRFRFIKHLKRHMAMKVMFTFQGLLSYRQFTGDISIDHDERKLTLAVFPRDPNIEGSTSNTKSLSGGERSFSTVAFLLSLWSCVDHPFYFLDEYDVFTDEVNREVMTLMLLNEAETKPQRQYTFLTPQDMALQSKDFIRIHRMADPNR